MKIFTKFTTLMLLVSMIVFFAGCKDEEELLPQVTADFTYTVNEDTGTVTFINTSTNATKFVWDFGDGETSTEINPIKTYPSGTYTVRLTATNVSGASNFIEDTIVINIRLIMSLPITFDNANINYTPTVFGGTSFAIVDNPDVSGTNNVASKVGAITNSGAAFEGIFFDLGSDIDLATGKRISMNFWADEATTVLVKLEEGTAGALEVTSAHGGTGWEKISFDFNSSAQYSRLTLFVDGPGTTAGTFYIDDISQEVILISCTEETVQSLNAADFNLTFKDDPTSSIISDNAGFEWASNPDADNEVNSSCKVGKISRSAASLFANNQINLDAKLDFNVNSGFKVKVFSDVPGFKLLLKLEDKTNAAVFTELEVTSTKTNEWEELTFPFASSHTNKYDKIILFFDLNTNNEKIYYFDDLKLYTASGGGGGGCTGTLVAAPSLPVDFESCATFLSSENFGAGITSELVANPFKTGINTSNYVLKVSKPAGSDFFAGIQNTFASNFDLTTTNVFKVKVYSTKANVVFRFELALNPQTVPVTGNPAPVFRTITTANEWTEVSFTFTGLPGGPTAYNQLVIKPDNTETDSPITTDGMYYIDDLILSVPDGGGATEPSVAAPNPPARAADDVISIFSNAYTNITGVDYNPNWGQATVVTTIDIAGNATLKYAGLNYQGTDFSGNAQDVSGMEFLHIDYWTANSTALNASIISSGPSEKAKALTVPTAGNWTSIDIPLTDFAPPVNLADLIQLKFDGNGDIFLDNIYFYKSGPPPTEPTTPAPTPPVRAAEDVISIFSNAYTNITGVDYNPNWGQATVVTTIDIAGNATLKYAGLNYQGTDFSGNAQDASGMEFLHIDYWTANSTALNASIISSGPQEKAKALTVPTAGNWTSIDIPLTDFVPPVNLADLIQLKFDGNGDIFLDNIYFYKSSGVAPGGNLATNGDFETGDATGWDLFQNGGTATLDNTTSNGGTWSGKLATGGPSNPAFKQERIGAGTVKAGDVVQIKFDHKGAVVQPGAVFNVLLFGEGAGGASFTHVFNPAPVLGANWTTFTGTFTIAAGTDVSEGISFLIEAVCGGDAGCSVTANIDNVSVTLNP